MAPPDGFRLPEVKCYIRASGMLGLVSVFLFLACETQRGSVAKFWEQPTQAGIIRSGVNVRQAESPNSSPMKCAWPTASPLASHLTRPFRIVFMVSIPRNVRHAV